MSIFQQNERLGIPLPEFIIPFEEHPRSIQEQILAEWESIRAIIPDQILAFEIEIEQRLKTIGEEDNWDTVVELFNEISEFASRINELNLWQRIDPSLTVLE